jgi:hypothetical protein
MADEAHEQIEVAASPLRCFAVAVAFEQYPEWTSDVKQVTVIERDGLGRGSRVEYHIAGLGRRVRYVLDYDFTDAPHSFSWSLVEGDMLRVLDGRYAFSPVPSPAPSPAPTGDGTLIDYTLHVDLAVPLPGLVKRRASGMIMGNALRDLKQAVEAPVPDRTVEQDMTGNEPTEPAEPTGPIESRPPPIVPPHPDAVPFEDAGSEERPLPPPSIVESVISELLGAVPEVRDHVLEAADALLDAAKALIDAADRVVRQQRGEE